MLFMRYFYLITFSLLVHIQAQAQTANGVVLTDTGDAVIGATVVHESSGRHAHTNEAGVYNISEVQVGDTLEVSHLLFEPRVIIITDQEYQEVVMTERDFMIENIVISPSANTLTQVAEIDLQTRPVKNSQEVLRLVPGLVIGQHAGGGKAEQIFLRGFDIDHGTDIAINVDGMPVNMVSHAHGQGYADLHFLIPETVQRVEFDKGPYYADQGNFNTAGYVDFTTKRKLENHTVKVEVGQFNTMRALAMIDLYSSKKSNAYIASEYRFSNGYFESPQNFNRINVLGKYNVSLSEREFIGVTASYFDSEWTASGQIPQRAVDSGLITRFGAIDDTEGGNTSRINVKLDHSKQLSDRLLVSNEIYYSKYDFELFSNFTFFANDPVNGDQIQQKEGRHLFGLNSKVSYEATNKISIDGGVTLRADNSNRNQLSNTFARTTILNRVQYGDISEVNAAAYVQGAIKLGKFMVTPGLRLDYFSFNYLDRLTVGFSSDSNTAAIASPKLIVSYQANTQLQLYAKAGRGFHSNDTRVVLGSTNSILPAATGADLGMVWKPMRSMLVTAALWHLHLEQEFVYVGDAGIVELSGPTNRQGIDFGLRYQMSPVLYFDTDLNYTHARSADVPEGEAYIPLAPAFTWMSGISYQSPKKYFGSIRSRYIGDRPANEDYSQTAEGYHVLDLTVGRKIGHCTLSIEIENILDVDWNETQFATESRLADEPVAIDEIHFTPGSPLFVRAGIQLDF